VLGYEVHLYLQAMDSAQASSARLILALDDQDPSHVLGFALYLPSQDDPAACTLVYMAVQSPQRRHGISRAMLQHMIARHPHAELACIASQVPTFEAMGFQLLAAHGPQALMNTRDHSANGPVAVQDLTPIFESTQVRQIHAYLLKQHGKKAMSEAEKKRDRQLDQMTQRALTLVHERRASGSVH